MNLRLFAAFLLALGQGPAFGQTEPGSAGGTPISRERTVPMLSPEAKVRMEERARLFRERAAAVTEALRPARDALKLAHRHIVAGELPLAEKECRRAMSISAAIAGESAMPESYQTLGDILLLQGNPRAALDAYGRRLRTSDGPEVVLSIIIARCRLGDYAGALAEYTRRNVDAEWPRWYYAAEDLPGTSSRSALEASALLARGRWHCSHGDDARGALDYDAAQRRCPSSVAVAVGRAKLLLRQTRYEEAAAQFRIAARSGRSPASRHASERARGIAANIAANAHRTGTAGADERDAP